MKMSSEGDEERLKQRLMQRHLDRRKSKDTVHSSEVSKASNEASAMEHKIQNSSMNEYSTGDGGRKDERMTTTTKEGNGDHHRKRSRSPIGDRNSNDDVQRGDRRGKRRRGGKRRRRRHRQDAGEMYRDNRDVWQNQSHPRDGPYYDAPRDPSRNPPGYYDRYPYDRYPRDRYERDFRRHDRDFRRHDKMVDRGREPRGRSQSISDDSYDSYSSRSRSRSVSKERARDEDNGGSPGSSRISGRHRSSSRSSSRERSKPDKEEDAALTKDQRTVFVSQLVMRTDEYDIRRYFKKKAKCRINEVIFLKDRRTGRHKGSAYVELAKLADVPNAVKLSGQVPDFQRFPISIKGSDAEKNYDDINMNNVAIYENPIPTRLVATSTNGDSNKKFEIQNVYVGSIDRCVTQAQLFALFSQFGSLEKVTLQVDTTTGLSRGFAFLSYSDVKDANLAIQTMSGQQLAGRPM